MKSKINDRKIKLLLHKLGYLRLEIEVKTEELSNHEQAFNEKYYSSFKEEEEEPPAPASPASHPPDHIPPPVSEEAEEKIDEKVDESPSSESPQPADKEPEDMRKIWKQIAMATHPDKTGNDLEKTELYKKAGEAYKEKRYDEIIEIAIALGLDLENLSDETTKLLEKRVEDLEKKLHGIQHNVLWEWASGDEVKRTKIEKVLNSYRKKKKKKR